MEEERSGNGASAVYAAHFRDELDRAAAHWTNGRGAGNFRFGLLCNHSQAIAVLGPEFMKLVHQGKQPCFRYHLAGHCTGSFGGICKLQHSLIREPSRLILDGIKQRLQSRLTEFLAVAPKA